MNNSYSKIKEFIKKYPMTIAWRVKNHCKIIDKHLNDGEDILYMFTGQKYEGFTNIFNTYVIVFTNKRIILGTKRVLFGYFFKSITPDMYNDLTVRRGLIWGNIIIDTIKEVITISNIDIRALDEIETNITEIVIKQKNELGIVREKESASK